MSLILGFRRFARRRPLISFVMLAYGITWSFTIPFVWTWNTVAEQTFQPWHVAFLPAPFGPWFAAWIMSRTLEGRPAVRRLNQTLRAWRVGWRPWLIALLLPVTLVALAVLLSGAASRVFHGFSLSGAAFAPLALLLALPFGPLPEEPGWRGWFLPRLQTTVSPLRASLIIGVVWTFWHTPMFWFPGAAIPSFIPLGPWAVLLYLSQIIPLSILFTALFNRSRGSVLLAIVFHTAFNTAETVVFSAFSSPTDDVKLRIYLGTVGLMWLAALGTLLLPKVEPIRIEG